MNLRKRPVYAACGVLLATSACSGDGGDPATQVTVTQTVTATTEVTETVTAPVEAAEASTETVTVTETVTATGANDEGDEDQDEQEEAVSNTVSGDIFTVTLLSWDESEMVTTLRGEEQATKGGFVTVYLNVRNDSSGAEDFSGWDVQLVDAGGRTHDSVTLIGHPQDPLTFNEIQAGLSMDGGVLFDIPADAEASMLLIPGGGYGSAMVQLPLD